MMGRLCCPILACSNCLKVNFEIPASLKECYLGESVLCYFMESFAAGWKKRRGEGEREA